jgi:hypothetical protein
MAEGRERTQAKPDQLSGPIARETSAAKDIYQHTCSVRLEFVRNANAFASMVIAITLKRAELQQQIPMLNIMLSRLANRPDAIETVIAPLRNVFIQDSNRASDCVANTALFKVQPAPQVGQFYILTSEQAFRPGCL